MFMCPHRQQITFFLLLISIFVLKSMEHVPIGFVEHKQEQIIACLLKMI